MQPANDHPSVLSKLAMTNHIHLQRLSISTSPVFPPQDVQFARFTAVVGSHGSGKSYLLKIVEESLPKYGNEPMRFPPASRSRWKDIERAEVGAVAGTHAIHMRSGWKPEKFTVDLAGPRAESFTYKDEDEDLRVTVPLNAHRAFGDYQMWMQDVESPDRARHFEGSWAADSPTLDSINRILGPESYLSPRGHIAFLDEIARRTLAGGFQTIIATHSEAMIRRIPTDLLRLTVRGPNGVQIRDKVSHDEVIVALGYEQSVKYLALVEDSLGEEILRMALAFFVSDHGRSWDIVRCGGTGEARKTLTLLSTMKRLVAVLVLDGDQRSNSEEADVYFFART